MAKQEREIEFIPIANLRFDPENPRLPSTVDGTDEDAVLTWLLARKNIIELMIAIGERGYFPGEPLLVVEEPEGTELYRVVEGNRRLAACKLLLDPGLATTRIKAATAASDSAEYKDDVLPALVFDGRPDILTYLGYRHVTGVQKWDSLTKAKYLAQLYQLETEGTLDEKCRALARAIGSRSSYVRRLLAGLVVYDRIEENDFFAIEGLGEESLSFAILTTALGYVNLAKYLGVDETTYPGLEINLETLGKFTKWAFEKGPDGKTRLGESRNLSDLAAIVDNEEALRAFEEKEEPLSVAVLYTAVPAERLHSAIVSARDQLRLATRHLYKVKEPSEEHSDILQDILTLATDLKNGVDRRLSESEQNLQ